MSDYQFGKNEFPLMEETSVHMREGSEERSLDKVILTNENLVLVDTVSTGLFKSETYVKRCPLENLQGADYDPQVLVSKLDDEYWLQALFESETVSLRFSENAKWNCERWAAAIKQAAQGDFASIATDGKPPTEIDEFINGAKDFLGGIFGKGENKAETGTSTPPSRPASVSTKCIGCHAPLTGRRGSKATCPYCDTVQTL